MVETIPHRGAQHYFSGRGSQGEMRRIFSMRFSRVLLSCVSASLAFRRRSFRTRRCRRRMFRCFSVIGIGLPPSVDLQNYNGMYEELQGDRTLSRL
jgi:hypothetical protein